MLARTHHCPAGLAKNNLYQSLMHLPWQKSKIIQFASKSKKLCLGHKQKTENKPMPCFQDNSQGIWGGFFFSFSSFWSQQWCEDQDLKQKRHQSLRDENVSHTHTEAFCTQGWHQFPSINFSHGKWFSPHSHTEKTFFAACGVPPYSSLPSHSAITHSRALLFPLSEEFSLFQANVIQQTKLSRQSGSDDQNLFLAWTCLQLHCLTSW